MSIRDDIDELREKLGVDPITGPDELQSKIFSALEYAGYTRADGEIKTGETTHIWGRPVETMGAEKVFEFVNYPDYKDIPHPVQMTIREFELIKRRFEFVDRLMSKKAKKANRNK